MLDDPTKKAASPTTLVVSGCYYSVGKENKLYKNNYTLPKWDSVMSARQFEIKNCSSAWYWRCTSLQYPTKLHISDLPHLLEVGSVLDVGSSINSEISISVVNLSGDPVERENHRFLRCIERGEFSNKMSSFVAQNRGVGTYRCSRTGKQKRVRKYSLVSKRREEWPDLQPVDHQYLRNRLKTSSSGTGLFGLFAREACPPPQPKKVTTPQPFSKSKTLYQELSGLLLGGSKDDTSAPNPFIALKVSTGKEYLVKDVPGSGRNYDRLVDQKLLRAGLIIFRTKKLKRTCLIGSDSSTDAIRLDCPGLGGRPIEFTYNSLQGWTVLHRARLDASVGVFTLPQVSNRLGWSKTANGGSESTNSRWSKLYPGLELCVGYHTFKVSSSSLAN